MFIGVVFFGNMLKSVRKYGIFTVNKTERKQL